MDLSTNNTSIFVPKTVPLFGQQIVLTYLIRQLKIILLSPFGLPMKTLKLNITETSLLSTAVLTLYDKIFRLNTRMSQFTSYYFVLVKLFT